MPRVNRLRTGPGLCLGHARGGHRGQGALQGMGTGIAGGDRGTLRVRGQRTGGHGRARAGPCGRGCDVSEDIENIPPDLRGLRRRCKAD